MTVETVSNVISAGDGRGKTEKEAACSPRNGIKVHAYMDRDQGESLDNQYKKCSVAKPVQLQLRQGRMPNNRNLCGSEFGTAISAGSENTEFI